MEQSRIRVLSDQTINKIAAGEVIENPGSVVKELVENSIDAGSTDICVEIQGGGRQLIRISDNGCGMSQDDALLSLERHATSKIREVEDIEELFTMGFRGEAIPSIASISKFTLLTCLRAEENQQSNDGTIIQVEGGRILSCGSAARAPGTTIEVKSLFFNVPVRRKFQKSPSYDVQEILKMLGLLALGHPEIQFELISDQKMLLKTIGSPKDLPFRDALAKRIECILGKDYAVPLIPFKFERDPYLLEGFIGPPSLHKSNRTGQQLFINQRAVYSPLVGAAVREGYGTMLPTQRFPIFVLHLTLPGSLVDVNVHPQKKEVRLRQEFQLKEMIIQAVQSALRQEQCPPQAYERAEEIDPPSNPFSHAVEREAPPFWAPYASLLSPFPKSSPPTEEKWSFQPSQSCLRASPPPLTRESSTATPEPTLLSRIETPKQIPRILTTLLGYCIVDPFHLNRQLFGSSADKREGGLALIDQRAAYSRIHYEKLVKNSSKHESQPLLLPLTLELSDHEASIVREHLEKLNEMGFGLREFSEQTFMIDAYPSFVKQQDLQTCLSLLIQDLVEMQTSRRLQSQREEQLALAACRASLPTAKRLSHEEAEGLLRQLIDCDLPGQCPLGNPTCIYYAPEELAKWFQ